MQTMIRKVSAGSHRTTVDRPGWHACGLNLRHSPHTQPNLVDREE